MIIAVASLGILKILLIAHICHRPPVYPHHKEIGVISFQRGSRDRAGIVLYMEKPCLFPECIVYVVVLWGVALGQQLGRLYSHNPKLLLRI